MASALAALAGCGFGSGSSSEGTATLTVTRDYGSEPMVEASVDDPGESETVLRMLDREADITTRYGGGFVQSIQGLAGGTEAGRRHDWFFYVNGVESPVGSADRSVAGGDRIWWDHHDWTDVMRVPAVVGSWPEPLLQASAGVDRVPVRIECAGESDPCDEVAERLAGEDVSFSEVEFGRSAGRDVLRVLVGRWSAIRRDAAAARIDQGPDASGVFARFEGRGAATEIAALGVDASPVSRLGAGAGLVAAVRHGEDPPTWVVSGVDPAGVEAAAAALDDAVLRDSYAVIVGAGSEATLPIPVVGG